jgi:hypothetical protein
LFGKRFIFEKRKYEDYVKNGIAAEKQAGFIGAKLL